MFEIVMDFINAFIFIFFLEKFLKLKRGNYVVYLLTATTGYALVIISLNAVFYYEGMLGISIYVMLLFVLAVVLMEGSWKEKLYYSLLINSMSAMVGLIVAKFIALVNARSLIWVYSGVGIKRIIAVVSVQILCAIVLAITYKIKTNFGGDLSGAEENVGLTLLLVTCIVDVVLNKIELYSESNIVVEELMVVVILSMLLVNIIIYYLLYRIHQLNYMNLKSQDLKRGIQAYEKSTKEMRQKYEGLRKIRHDMRNSYIMALGLLQNEETKQLEEYLRMMSEQIESSNTLVYTGYAYLDSLLNMKFTEIQNNRVNLTYEIGAGEYNGIEELDLCSILGNLLDNALEAVIMVEENLRRINVNIRCDENKIMIMVRNTVADDARRTEEDILKTDKRDKKSHGLGIKIIKELAEKYGGGFNWAMEDNEFQASVLLFLK